MNQVNLHGFTGGDPKIRTTESGKKVASFSIATQSFRKTSDGGKTTDWHNLIFWEKLAELCEKYVKKGSELIVQGEIQYRSYVDKDGVTKYITEIVCHNLEFCGKKEAEPGIQAKDEFQGGSANKEAIVNKSKEQTGSKSDINLLPGANDELSDLPF